MGDNGGVKPLVDDYQIGLGEKRLGQGQPLVGEDDQLAFESVELSWIAAPAEVTALVDGAILVDVAAGRLPDRLPQPWPAL